MKYIRYPNTTDDVVKEFIKRNINLFVENVTTIGELLDYIKSSRGHSQVRLHWSCVEKLEQEPTDRMCKTFSHERICTCASYDTIEVVELL